MQFKNYFEKDEKFKFKNNIIKLDYINLKNNK